MLSRIIKQLFNRPFRHPLQKLAPRPARTPQEIERNKHKAAILQARVSRFFEKFNPPTTPVMKALDPVNRVENFISFAYDRVDVRMYEAGL